MDEDLSIRGTFEESSLPELLRSVSRSHETGILTCFVEDSIKSIYLRRGQIIFAHSSNPDERLGESLLVSGKVTVRELLDAAGQVRPGRRLGSVLCDLRALTPEELVEAVRKQVRDIILSLFRVTQGRYELSLKEIDTHEMILLAMSTEDIIFAGIKTINSWTRISRGIGSFTAKVFPSPDAGRILQNLAITAEESDIFSLCEKRHFTVEDICSMSYLSNFETCRLVWAFLMVGALGAEEGPASDSAAPGIYTTSADSEYELHELVENYNDIYSYLYDFAYKRIGDKAIALAQRAMTQVESTMPNMARGLTLDSYGRLDFDDILKNLAPIPEANRMELVAGALEEIVYALLFEVGSHFGPADQKKLTQEMQTMRKK